MKQNQQYIKLSEWAKKYHYTYRGAYGLFKRNGISNAIQTNTGTILIPLEITPKSENTPKSCYIYCRVSSPDKKDDLHRQIQRCTDFAIQNGYILNKTFSEIASGMNDSRPILHKLLNLDLNNTTIIVEHKDRLTRFGFNYFSTFLNKLNCQLIVINQNTETDNPTQELMKDFVSLVTSFCARIYGIRKSTRKSTLIKHIIQTSDNE